jgi:rubrerythrin
VKRLDHDRDPVWLQRIHQRGCDFLRKPFLDLQSPRIQLDDPGDLGQPDDVVAGKVPDVALPEEREEVVLAEGEDLDVLHRDHFVVLFMENCAPQHLPRVLVVPLRQETDRILEPLRGLLQPFPVRIFPAAILKGLKQALRNEIDGTAFYRMASATARRDGARQMFRFLMEEEQRHREAILEQIRRMAQGTSFRLERGSASRKELAKFRSPLFTEDLVKASRQVEAEVAALSIGMTLEKRAIAQFAALQKKAAGAPRVAKIFADLAAWERDHLEILTGQYEQLREMYWEEARFWPF